MKISPIIKEKIEDKDKEKNNENTSFFSTGVGLFKSYIYNNYKNLSNKISNYSIFPKSEISNINISNPVQDINISDNHISKNTTKNIKNNKKNELLIFNNLQIKKNIYNFLENELKINNTKIDLRNCNNQNLQIQKYKEFKNKIIIYFFSSIIILKYYNIISITSLCVISLMKKIKIGNIPSNLIINKNQITLLLDNLWNISAQTSKNIYSKVTEIISNNIDKIALNEKYDKDKLINLFNNITDEIRNNCNFFIHIIKIIRNNINSLENQYFNKNDRKNNNIYEYKLRFYYIFCDILFTDMFYSSFVQSYEEEIKKQINEIIKHFDEQKEKTFLAIIFDLDSYKGSQIIVNENNTQISNNENDINENINDEILFNYQNCLQSIDL